MTPRDVDELAWLDFILLAKHAEMVYEIKKAAAAKGVAF